MIVSPVIPNVMEEPQAAVSPLLGIISVVYWWMCWDDWLPTVCIHHQCKHLWFSKGRQGGYSLRTGVRLMGSCTWHGEVIIVELDNSVHIQAFLHCRQQKPWLWKPVMAWDTNTSPTGWLDVSRDNCLSSLILYTYITVHYQMEWSVF